MPPFLRIAGVGALGGAAYATYEHNRLVKTYPIRGPESYHRLPVLKEPLGLVGPEYVYARIPVPQPTENEDPARKAVREAPLDVYILHFFSTVALQIEGWICKQIGYHSAAALDAPAPVLAAVKAGLAEEWVGGYFVTQERSPTSLVLYWTLPKQKVPNPTMPQGGTQEIAAVVLPGGKEIELSYGCTDIFTPGGGYDSVMNWAHLTYQRHLFDRAVKHVRRTAGV